MLDLSKSFGRFENVSFFGDHQDDKIIYYLPDEIKLSTRDNKENEYEFSLLLFHENKMEETSDNFLEDSAGSILQFSVNCTVNPDRLQKAFTALKEQLGSIPNDAILTTPLWTDGSVDLITLDRSSFEEASDSDMVKAIITSQRPSLTQNLKSIFNVKYDRRGTEIINSAISDGQGMLAVDYDLQFAALHPSVDLKITAFLSRCQTTARENLDANLKLTFEEIQLDLGAHFEWLTKKMVENGDIKIEVTNQNLNEEEEKLVDELVNEFKDKVMQQLFQTTLINNPSIIDSVSEKLAKLADTVTPIKVGFCYTFKEETISEDRIISVDYSERKAIIKHHNPKAILLDDPEMFAERQDDYVKKIILGDLWNSQSVSIELFHNFEEENNDLLSAEVIVWKQKEGILSDVPEKQFAIPNKVVPLANFIFTADDDNENKHISWLCDKEDNGGYYYQLRLLYSSNNDNVFTPTEIVTPPTHSFLRTISIVPNSYTFFRNIPIMIGNIDLSIFSYVEIVIDIEDSEGILVGQSKRFIIDSQNKEANFVVRGKDKSNLNLWVSKIFHFKDRSKPSLKSTRCLLKDCAIVINSPLTNKEIYPIILGETGSVQAIYAFFTVVSPALDRPVSTTKILKCNDFAPINLTQYSPEDSISYQITKVYKDSDGKYKQKQIATEQVYASELSSIVINLDDLE